MTRLQFTVTVLFLLSLTSVAHADRVVLLPPQGEVPQDQLVQVEAALATALDEGGHVPVTEQGNVGADVQDAPPPETANELRAVAELQDAQWTMVPRVLEASDGGYWLRLRVGYADETRVEELDFEVRDSRQAARLQEVVGAMVRPEGLGDDAVRLGGEDRAARQAEAGGGEEQTGLESDLEAAEREAAEREEAERRAAEAAAQAEKEKQEAAEREAADKREQAEERRAWENRDRYGAGGSLHLQAGYGLRGIVKHEDRARGGLLHSIELKVGKSFDALSGFELRGGVDVVLGEASNGFAVYGGAVYMFSPFTAPIHIGANVELGMHKATTGNDVPQLMVRGGPVVAWRVVGDLYVEGAPEVMYLSANDGAVTLGGSIRAGWRF